MKYVPYCLLIHSGRPSLLCSEGMGGEREVGGRGERVLGEEERGRGRERKVCGGREK